MRDCQQLVLAIICTITAHNAVVTAAIFAPKPNFFFNARGAASGSLQSGDVVFVPRKGSTSDSSRSWKSGVSSWGRSKSVSLSKKSDPVHGYVIITADYTGSIKVLLKHVMEAN